jgi:hypothetical protein
MHIIDITIITSIILFLFLTYLQSNVASDACQQRGTQEIETTFGQNFQVHYKWMLQKKHGERETHVSISITKPKEKPYDYFDEGYESQLKDASGYRPTRNRNYIWTKF